MKDELRTSGQLIDELEASEAERKRAEETMQESMDHFRFMVESIDLGINLIDCDHNIVMVNAAQARHFNKSPREMVGKKCYRELEKRDAVCPHCPGVEAIATGRPAQVETQGVRDDGSRFNVRLRAFPVLRQDGTVRGFVEIGQDITERKRAEEALAQERNLLRALMDTVPDHIYFKDTDSRFIRVSKAQAEWLGLSEPAQAVGKTDFDFFTEEHARLAYEDEQEIVRTGQPLINVEEKETWPDGHVTWASTTKMPLRDEGGRIVGTFGISRDITDRKAAEEKIEHLNLVLSAIRNVNQLITRERDRDRLLQGACETLIATRGYHHAWIVLLDESGGVVTTAEAGLGEDFLPLVERLKRGELTDRVQRAMKHSGVVVTKDPASTCADCPLSDRYDGRGAVTIRLEYGGKVYGLLSVSIPRDLAADEEERALFEEVAGDIAFALYSVELEERRKQAEKALQQREAVLGAMALAAEKFLQPSDWEQDMQAALAYLGKAADVSRAIIWEVSTSDDGKYLISGCYEWITPEAKLAPQVGLQNVPVFRRWRDLLPHGEIIAGHVRDFSAKEQEFFVSGGIKSILVVPIFVKDAWWGFMGFDQGGIEREWTEAEIDTLKTAASILGGALERKRAEQALRESEEKYRTILENIEDGYYEVDVAGNFTFFNDALCKVFGYSADELMGMNERQLMDDENAKVVYKTFNAVYRTGKPVKALEHEFIRKDGTRRSVEVSVSLISDSAGEPAGFRGIIRDITERKRAEEKIEHLNLVLSAIRNVNQLITRERDRDRLLQGACETLIETRGYHHAWIALLDESGGLMTTAEAGLGEDFLPLVERLKHGELTDCGRRALNQSGGVVTEDPSSICADCPLSSMYDGRGAVTIWLEYGETVYGLLSVSIPRDLAADEEGQALFEEVAGDIAFALHNIELEKEAQRRAAQAALVYEVGQRVSRKLELDELLPEIVTTVRDAFDYYGVMILLVDEETNRLTMQSIAGAYADIFPKDLSHAIGEGMTGYAAASGETQISGDVSQDPHYMPEADEETKSELAVPIKSGEKVIGVLDIQSDQFDAFDETDVMLMETLADQIAGAVENARLFEETQTRAEELAVLNEMGRALTAMLDVDAVVENIYHHASRLIDTTNFYVALYDPELDEVSFPLYAEGDQIRTAGRRQAGQGMTEHVIRTREPLLIQETVAARLEELGIEMIGTEAQSWLGVPMTIGDQVLGVIAVQSYTTPHLYNERHRDLLSAIANQAAIAIKNARLFDETHSRAERLAVVNRIAKTASATLHLDDLMETVYREIAPVFQGDAFFITLYDEETDELDFCFLVDEGARRHPRRIPLNGLISLVITEKKPLVIRDLEREQGRLPAPVLVGGDKPSASWLGAPLMVGERVIGVINVQSYRPHAWGEEDELLLLTIADQVAVALENARLFEETQTRAEELATLNEMGRALTTMLDVDAVIESLYHHASRLIDTTNFYVALYDAEQDMVSFPLYIEEEQTIRQEPFRGSKGLSGYVIRTREPLLIEENVAARVEELGIEAIRLEAMSWLGVPMTIGGRVIGVISAHSHTTPRLFNEHHRDLLSAIANQAAIAIENARLFEQAQKEITERKRAEKALKGYSERLEEMVEERTQELRDAQEQLIRQEKLAVLGQLAGGVGHELRNPLGAISNAVYFLNMVLEEPEPEVKETLEILEKEVKTSETIISSLLDFARTKAPTRRKVHVNDIIQEALSRATVPTNVEVVSQLDETLPIILADPDQLGQVFGNIILNAIQAMPEGGQLVVKSDAPSPEWVAIPFADTGVGIPEENLDKLFEPLFTTKAKGIGLGMAVTKTLVEGHGGTIEVESEIGVGTTFTVWLPISAG